MPYHSNEEEDGMCQYRAHECISNRGWSHQELRASCIPPVIPLLNLPDGPNIMLTYYSAISKLSKPKLPSQLISHNAQFIQIAPTQTVTLRCTKLQFHLSEICAWKYLNANVVCGNSILVLGIKSINNRANCDAKYTHSTSGCDAPTILCKQNSTQ